MRGSVLKAVAAALAVLFVVPQAAFGNGSNTRASDGKVLEPGAVFYPGDNMILNDWSYILNDDSTTTPHLISLGDYTFESAFQWDDEYDQWWMSFYRQGITWGLYCGYGCSSEDDVPSAFMCTGGNGSSESSPFIFEAVTTMYRLYNPNSGEHFYTSNMDERNTLISLGWNDEGIGWYAPSHSNTPVYRLYNSNAGEHHYTTDVAERNNLVSLGWNDEGIGWYSDDSRRVPLYRQYNPNEFANNHNYTTSLEENNWLVSLGWQAEDIGWYGVGCA